jgi:hypothetical protein
MTNFIDITDKPFERLTPRWIAGRKDRKIMWLCSCECGNLTVVSYNNLSMGTTRSCGCLRDEKISDVNRTHGHSRTPEYVAWCEMKKRCTNPNCKCYPIYGGAPIPVRVCERWLQSFENFLADVGMKPEPKHLYSLGRHLDVGDYQPENAKWMTREEQAAESIQKAILANRLIYENKNISA